MLRATKNIKLLLNLNDAHKFPCGSIALFTQCRKALSFGIIMCCLTFATGCVEGMMQSSGPSVNLPPASHETIAEAREAWDNGAMQNAENLYARATKLSLPAAEQAEAWERFALAAANNGRPHGALEALDQWAKMVPGVDATVSWQSAWLTSITRLPPRQAVEQATRIWDDAQRPAQARAQAAIVLMGRSWPASSSIKALPLMHDLYVARELSEQQKLEQITVDEARYMSSTTLQSLGEHLAKAQNLTFPATLIFVEQMRRDQGVPAAVQTQIKNPALFADATLVQRILGGDATALLPPPGGSGDYQSTCLVLALPASGSIMPFAQKIREGADAAKNELAALGTPVDLRHVDTMKSQWLQEIAALPPQCVVVGGPLRSHRYAEAKAHTAVQTRRIFAFMPTLQGQDEGNVAWRLFPSPQDQINALLDFTREIGITSFGAFYPSDTFGTRMNELFVQIAQRQQSAVRAVSYNPQSMDNWLQSAAELLQPQKVGNVPFSTADFGAVFLPDSWKHMDMITDVFQANGDDKQVLMGTSLWEQSLMSGGIVGNTSKYTLAIFPAAWNPAKSPAALQTQGLADFWTGLGYDFVRLGAGLALNTPVNAQEVNSRLQSAQRMEWAMAPLTWDVQGKAAQKLFIFSLTDGAATLADASHFSQKRTDILSRFESRRMSVEQAPESAPENASVQPVTP